MVVESKPKKFDLSNRLYILVIILFVFCLISLLWRGFYQWKSFEQDNYDQLTVSGEGKVYVEPDLATITLGLETNGEDVQEITKTSTESMNKMIEEIKKLGVNSADIQTTQYSVNPQYSWTDEGRQENGYQIEQNVEVKIRDFSKISNVLSVATQSGANVINSLQFSIENEDTAKENARAEAIEKAKIKAEWIAAQTGIKLGKITSVYESSYTNGSEIYYSAKTASSDEALAIGGGGISSQIESGQKEITVTVNLTYKIK